MSETVRQLREEIQERRSRVDLDDAALPGNPTWKERLQDAYDRRTAAFRIWRDAGLDQTEAHEHAGAAEKMRGQVLGLTNEVRASMKGISETNAEIRRLNRQRSGWSKNWLYQIYKNKRLDELGKRSSMDNARINKLLSQIQETEALVKTAEENKAHLDRKVYAVAQKHTENLRKRLLPYETAQRTVAAHMEKYTEEAARLQTELDGMRSQIQAAEAIMQTESVPHTEMMRRMHLLHTLEGKIDARTERLTEVRDMINRCDAHMTRLAVAYNNAKSKVDAITVRYMKDLVPATRINTPEGEAVHNTIRSVGAALFDSIERGLAGNTPEPTENQTATSRSTPTTSEPTPATSADSSQHVRSPEEILASPSNWDASDANTDALRNRRNTRDRRIPPPLPPPESTPDIPETDNFTLSVPPDRVVPLPEPGLIGRLWKKLVRFFFSQNPRGSN